MGKPPNWVDVVAKPSQDQMELPQVVAQEALSHLAGEALTRILSGHELRSYCRVSTCVNYQYFVQKEIISRI